MHAVGLEWRLQWSSIGLRRREPGRRKTVMSEIPVFYATTHGQTRRIAERVADVLRSDGHASLALDLTSEAAHHYNWKRADGAVLAASLHGGAHQAAAYDFARAHAARLNAIPSWFISVSLSAASTRADERMAAERLARVLVEDAGWKPRRLSCVAGRLAYTQYPLLTRWLMRRIARKEGASTDTSRDHEFTNWSELTTLSMRFGRDVWSSVGCKTVSAGA
jgi:menaquinone-dependent protoporphyrinogen oxidase